MCMHWLTSMSTDCSEALQLDDDGCFFSVVSCVLERVK